MKNKNPRTSQSLKLVEDLIDGKYSYHKSTIELFKKIALLRTVVFNWCLENKDDLNPDQVVIKKGMTTDEQFAALAADRPIVFDRYRTYVPTHILFKKFLFKYERELYNHFKIDIYAIMKSINGGYDGIIRANIMRDIMIFRKAFNTQQPEFNKKFNTIFIGRESIIFKKFCHEHHKDNLGDSDVYISRFGHFKLEEDIPDEYNRIGMCRLQVKKDGCLYLMYHVKSDVNEEEEDFLFRGTFEKDESY